MNAYKLLNHKHPDHQHNPNNPGLDPKPICYSRLTDAQEDQQQHGGVILRTKDKATLKSGQWIKPFGYGKLTTIS